MTKWIRVEERLPDNFSTIVMVSWQIVYPMFQVPSVKIGIYNKMTKEFYEYENFPIITNGAKRLDLNEKITHWMPLPEAPQEEV